jgi:hypothetical protein
MDPGDTVTISLLVQKERKENVDYHPVGKVGGIRKIGLGKRDYQETPTESFLGRAFGGSPLVQIARLIVYFFAAIFLIIFAIILITSFGDARTQRRRRRREEISREILIHKPAERDDVRTILRRTYVDLGLRGMMRIRTILSRPDDMKDDYKAALERTSSPRYTIQPGETEVQYLERTLIPGSSMSDYLIAMESLGFFSFENGTTVVELEESLNLAIEELNSPALRSRVTSAEPSTSEAELDLRPRRVPGIMVEGRSGTRFVVDTP